MTALAQGILMYFVLPLWLAAGLADWVCHRATRIEVTAGPRESVFHLLLLAEMSVPVMLALFFEINSLVIAVMLAAYALHELTTWFDLRYATSTREVLPVEQMVHSLLEMLPLMGLGFIILLHWGQFLALFGIGDETGRFLLTLKQPSLPLSYTLSVIAASILFNILPFTEELIRGLRAARTLKT
jgi:hypothetical protein